MVLSCNFDCLVLFLVEPEKNFFVAIHGGLALVQPVINSLIVQEMLYVKYFVVLAFPYDVTVE